MTNWFSWSYNCTFRQKYMKVKLWKWLLKWTWSWYCGSCSTAIPFGAPIWVTAALPLIKLFAMDVGNHKRLNLLVSAWSSSNSWGQVESKTGWRLSLSLPSCHLTFSIDKKYFFSLFYSSFKNVKSVWL